MKLTRLLLARAPGLDKGLGEHHLEPGLNVVFGPNESGKSTLARAIQSTLWPQGRRDGVLIDVESDWEADGVEWSARHDGDTSWTQGGQPAEAGPELPRTENAEAYRLHLRDLIAGQDDEGDQFAARVREALDGGFDLTRRVTETRGPRFGQAEKRTLANTEVELRRIEGERSDLARRQDDLQRLERAHAAADQARVERALLERVEVWLAARGRLADARVELDTDTTPDLQGHEQAELLRLESEIDVCDTALANHEGEVDDARRQLATLDLSANVPGDEVLSAWLEDARELAGLEAEVETARAAVAEVEEAEARARTALHASTPQPVAATPLFAPSLDDVEALAQWLELRSALAADRRAVVARRAQIERRAADRQAGESRRLAELDRDALAEARRTASEVLRAGPGLATPFVVATAAGAAVALASWQGALKIVPALASWQGALRIVPGQGEGLAVGATLIGGGLGVVVGRLLARRRYAKGLIGLGLSDDAASLEPTALLDEVQAALAACDAAASDARDLVELDLQAESIEERAPTLEARRLELVDGFGIDPGVEDLTLTTWAQRIRDHGRAADAFATARLRHSAASSSFERTRALLRERIAPFLPTPATSPTSTTAPVPPTTTREGVGLVQALQKRVAEGARADETISRCEIRLTEIAERRTAHDRQRGELLVRLNLADADAATAREKLRGWMEGLDQRLELRRRFDQASTVLAERTRELEGHDDLLQLGADDVAVRLERARERESEADQLSEQIGAVKREVLNAEREDRVEVALAGVSDAREALEERRSEVFEDIAARLLIEDVSEQIGTRHRPEVLSRATELFGLFTRHRYELEVATFGEAVRFVAWDTESNERKQLGQLSDGTRMQLLLAARLAFVHEGERGVHPPLVLDEALSSSDSARMTAMTDALVAEAATGRQVFYMTNDPGDVEFWRAACERADVAPPHVVRLGETARAANAAALEGFEPPVPIAPVPSPVGLDAKQYGMKLGVPLPDPWSESGELHLFHLLSDDLELLHRVLDQGHVDRLGHFESRRRAGTAETLLGADVVDRIVFRALVAERFFDAWKRGRGKRIRPSDFQACDGLSDLYKDRLAAIVTEEGSDARALMALIEAKDKRLSGLGKRREIVEAFLQEQGFFSEEEPLGVDALVSEVSVGIAEALFGLGRDEQHERLRDAESLVRHWARLLEPGDDAA